MARTRSLNDCGFRSYLIRLQVARLLASSSNDIPLWRTVRRKALSRLLIAPGLLVGSHVRLDRSHPTLSGRLTIGRNVVIGPRVMLDTCGGLVIEDGVTLSLQALVLTHDHTIKSRSVHWRQQPKIARPVRIGKESWVGADATVLGPTSEIGEGAIVGASSVVTRPVPAYAVAVGNPARVVRDRD